MKLVTADGAEYTLDLPEMTIGRYKKNHITITDAKISGSHAVIRRDGDAYLLADSGSTNGTFVNGNRLTGTHRLQPGDQIRLGDTILMVQGAGAAGEAVDKTVFDPALAGAKRPAPVAPAPPAPVPASRPAPVPAPAPAVAPAPAPAGAMMPAYPAHLAPYPTKDRSLALILEIVLPLFLPALGVGWLYAGQTATGILLLIGFLIFQCLFYGIAVATSGIGLLCTVPIDLAVIAVSAAMLHSHTKSHPELFRS